jgi:hypothetical protein
MTKHPADVGVRKTADALGISKSTVANAKKIAGIDPDAKDAAAENGLTRDELLRVADAEPARQVATVHELAERRALRIDADVKERAAEEVAEIIAEYVPADAWDGVKANLYAAGATNIAHALSNLVGAAVMDGRHK